MSMDRKIRLIAGVLLLASLALGVWVSEWWLLFTAFIGVNLTQSSITGWCLMEDILRATKIHTDPVVTADGRADRPHVGRERRPALHASNR
jgi:hypothetical protein